MYLKPYTFLLCMVTYITFGTNQCSSKLLKLFQSDSRPTAVDKEG